MKATKNIKKTTQVIMVTAIVLTSVILAKNMAKNIKHLYEMQPAGSGRSCLYNMIR